MYFYLFPDAVYGGPDKNRKNGIQKPCKQYYFCFDMEFVSYMKKQNNSSAFRNRCTEKKF